LYFLAACLAKVFLKVFYSFKVYGFENLPKDKGFIVASNHIGWLDVIAVGVSVYPFYINYMAKKELFSNPILSFVLTKLNAFPIDREKPALSSLKKAIEILKNGGVLGIFPTGTRSKEDLPFKKGVAYIAKRANVSIIPVFFEGPEGFSFKYLFTRPKVKVFLGKPLCFSNEDDEQILFTLKKEIQKIKPKQ